MNDENYLAHYGTKRHSGRYPYGSGEDPFQHEAWYLSRCRELEKEGYSEKEIADHFDMTINELRRNKANAIAAEEADLKNRVKRLIDEGHSNTAIAELVGKSEGTIRNWRKDISETKAKRNEATKNFLEKRLEETGGYLDVGSGVEVGLGITRTKLDNVLQAMKNEGYEVHNIEVPQVSNPNQKTIVKVLAPPGTSWAEIMNNKIKINSLENYTSKDGGETYETFKYPKSIDSSRVYIRYNEDGGKEKDGVIELRRGVEDISLGESRYAQVRVAVDNKHYLKGMAMYADDIPDGYDVVFNTNKSLGTPMEKVFKPLKTDPSTGEIDVSNPFGANIKPQGQREYILPDGTKELSVINKVNEEGDWGEWAKTLSSQFLSKQSTSLIKQQLTISYDEKISEYNDILSTTNPVVQKKLLETFASDCDASATDLKAASLPRQGAHVILPLPDIKENEIYAPNYKNGEEVVLIRYPHGGTFEIPRLRVNNNYEPGKRLIGNAQDAVGIHPTAAQRLSGADFDGDTVMVIPVNDRVKVTTTEPFEKLKNFDPSEAYPAYPGMPRMDGKTKQREMGNVSNLITDMTLKGASPSELERAVRHSMVVIDAEKHNLNYKQSEIDSNIAELKEIYQGGARRGASTLISRAQGRAIVDERKPYSKIDPDTGEVIYQESGRKYKAPVKKSKAELRKDAINSLGKNANEDDIFEYIKTHKGEYKRDSDGNVIVKEYEAKINSKKMMEVKDAMDLVSDRKTPQEMLYASYANKLKALANEARKKYIEIPTPQTNSSAKEAYKHEVDSLDAKLNVALRNSPKERQAQILANDMVKAKLKSNPDIRFDKDAMKKLKNRALAYGRTKVQAGKETVKIDEKEWEAIQAGAISASKLEKILNNADLDVVRKLATPKETKLITDQKIAFIKLLDSRNYTNAEIAERTGLSATTVGKLLKE